jgi:hypothetical protein
MDRPSFLTKSITILGVDGNHVTVSETAERREVVVAIQQNDEHGRIATARLNADQFKALCRSQYDLEVEAETENENKKEAM